MKQVYSNKDHPLQIIIITSFIIIIIKVIAIKEIIIIINQDNIIPQAILMVEKVFIITYYIKAAFMENKAWAIAAQVLDYSYINNQA